MSESVFGRIELEVELEGEDVVRIESGVNAGEVNEALNQQGGGEQRDDGEGDFADDQNIMHAAVSGSAGTSSARVQRGVERDS